MANLKPHRPHDALENPRPRSRALVAYAHCMIVRGEAARGVLEAKRTSVLNDLHREPTANCQAAYFPSLGAHLPSRQQTWKCTGHFVEKHTQKRKTQSTCLWALQYPQVNHVGAQSPTHMVAVCGRGSRWNASTHDGESWMFEVAVVATNSFAAFASPRMVSSKNN